MSGLEWKLHGRRGATTTAAEGSTWFCSCCGTGASFSTGGFPRPPATQPKQAAPSTLILANCPSTRTTSWSTAVGGDSLLAAGREE